VSQNQTFNGVVYPIPVRRDLNWAPPLTRYLAALGTYALNIGGGAYPLTASLNLSGGGFGVLADYFSGPLAGIASQGRFRMTKNGMIAWRNNAGGGDNLLATDSSDNLTWNGTAVPVGLSTLTDGKIWIGSGSNLPVAQTLTGDITVTNAGVTAIGAGKIVDAQISNSAAVAYSKLNLSGSIVNADIYSSAAIALSKLAALGTAKALQSNAATGAIEVSSVTNTELGYVSGVTSALQTQLNAKQATGNYITALTGDVTAAGPGSSAATLATVNANVGSFTLATITVNAKGLITAASNGSAGTGTVTNVSGTANQITSTNPTTTPVLALASPLTLPGAMTAGGAIAMGTNKITGLGNGTAATDAAAFGQLKIFQTVMATSTAVDTTSSGTFVNTSLSVSITPTSSSSKILLYATGIFQAGTGSGNATLANNTTNLLSSAGGFRVSATLQVPAALCYLDSPATTSAITYRVRFLSNGGTAQWGETNITSVLVAQEVQ
jgi:hypothetical protein